MFPEHQDKRPRRPDDFSDRKAAVAIGIGCKRSCSSEAIVALVERAIAAASCAGAPATLFTHEAKKSEAGLVKRLAQGQKMIVKGWCRLGQDTSRQFPAVRLVAMRLPTGELLALACSGNPRGALAAYRDRWKIDPSATLRAIQGHLMRFARESDGEPS